MLLSMRKSRRPVAASSSASSVASSSNESRGSGRASAALAAAAAAAAEADTMAASLAAAKAATAKTKTVTVTAATDGGDVDMLSSRTKSSRGAAAAQGGNQYIIHDISCGCSECLTRRSIVTDPRAAAAAMDYSFLLQQQQQRALIAAAAAAREQEEADAAAAAADEQQRLSTKRRLSTGSGTVTMRDVDDGGARRHRSESRSRDHRDKHRGEHRGEHRHHHKSSVVRVTSGGGGGGSKRHEEVDYDSFSSSSSSSGSESDSSSSSSSCERKGYGRDRFGNDRECRDCLLKTPGHRHHHRDRRSHHRDRENSRRHRRHHHRGGDKKDDCHDKEKRCLHREVDVLIVHSNALTCLQNRLRACICDMGFTIEVMTSPGWDISGSTHCGRVMAKMCCIAGGMHTSIDIGAEAETVCEARSWVERFKRELAFKVSFCPPTACGSAFPLLCGPSTCTTTSVCAAPTFQCTTPCGNVSCRTAGCILALQEQQQQCTTTTSCSAPSYVTSSACAVPSCGVPYPVPYLTIQGGSNGACAIPSFVTTSSAPYYQPATTTTTRTTCTTNNNGGGLNNGNVAMQERFLNGQQQQQHQHREK